MNRATPLVVVLVLSLLCQRLHADDTAEMNALQAIEKAQGTVSRDYTKEGNPVIGVDLSARYLGRNKVGGKATLQILKELTAFPQLQTLNLGGCGKVTNAGLKELVACKQLRSLDLGGCGITDAGLKELAA